MTNPKKERKSKHKKSRSSSGSSDGLPRSSEIRTKPKGSTIGITLPVIKRPAQIEKKHLTTDNAPFNASLMVLVSLACGQILLQSLAPCLGVIAHCAILILAAYTYQWSIVHAAALTRHKRAYYEYWNDPLYFKRNAKSKIPLSKAKPNTSAVSPNSVLSKNSETNVSVTEYNKERTTDVKCSKDSPVELKPAAQPLPPKAMDNQWIDIRAGDDWPTKNVVKALRKTLDTVAGENPDQHVALWFKDGEPIIGRAWNENGKVAANFGWSGNEYKENVGSLQLLVEMADHIRGFDYSWLPFSKAALTGDNDWHPVSVNHQKGSISPAVITFNGKQILGKTDVRNEKSSAAFGGKESQLDGAACVSQTMVLCRKAKPGYKFD